MRNRLFPTLVVLLGVACGGKQTDTITNPGGNGGSGGNGGAGPVGPVSPFVVGQMQTDQAAYIEYTPGDAPLVILAPHGGTLRPAGLPDRSCSGCETSNDLETQALARLIVERFQAATGARPHLIVNRLHRSKFDANRDVDEATGGTAALRPSWIWLHAAADSAVAVVGRQGGRGLLLDLHGHAHAVARLELGYLLGDATLRSTDSVLASTAAMERSSVARLARDTRSTTDRGVSLLRGPHSLGTLLVAEGYRAVPSLADMAPRVGEAYFEGGYNTQRHGSVNGGSVDAIQIEAPNPGIRDTEANRIQFAEALVRVLRTYLATHYGWQRSP